MDEIKAPNSLVVGKKTIFLGGTIDMGNSEDWQKTFKEHLQKSENFKDVTLLNPRRDDWDSSWGQHKDNPQFREQVEWEFEAMRSADSRVFVFLPDSKSPVTIFELGLFIQKPCIIYCPFEFYRSGNIHIICEKFNKPVYTDWDEFLKQFK